VIYNLDNTSDPEAEAAIKAFQRDAFKAAAKGAGALAPAAEPELAFTAKVERKYVAAQIVESGIQVRARVSRCISSCMRERVKAEQQQQDACCSQRRPVPSQQPPTPNRRRRFNAQHRASASPSLTRRTAAAWRP
jgi:hypothetical protein